MPSVWIAFAYEGGFSRRLQSSNRLPRAPSSATSFSSELLYVWPSDADPALPTSAHVSCRCHTANRSLMDTRAMWHMHGGCSASGEICQIFHATPLESWGRSSLQPSSHQLWLGGLLSQRLTGILGPPPPMLRGRIGGPGGKLAERQCKLESRHQGGAQHLVCCLVILPPSLNRLTKRIRLRT